MNGAIRKAWALLGNARRAMQGRPKWSAAREYDYYHVERKVVEEHRERCAALARGGYQLSARLVRDMGLDDGVLAGATVLDIGAGEGVLSFGMKRAGAQDVWGVDAVPKQVWAAAEHSIDGVHFVIADASALPFEDGSFDLVTAHLVLHHIEPLAPLMAEIHRVLRPGGRFVALEPTRTLGALTHEVLSENEAPISPRYVGRELQRAGFKDVRRRYHWSRFDTGILGPLSPGYRFVAIKSGDSTMRAGFRVKRRLDAMRLRGLQIDSGCQFAQLATAQAEEILKVLAN